tara:strand:- start:1020 stop:1214 length:195 start_codon:yes stop_codon:yes gene_type:complete
MTFTTLSGRTVNVARTDVFRVSMNEGVGLHTVTIKINLDEATQLMEVMLEPGEIETLDAQNLAA